MVSWRARRSTGGLESTTPSQGEHVAKDHVDGGDDIEDIGEERHQPEADLLVQLSGERCGEGEELVVLGGSKESTAVALRRKLNMPKKTEGSGSSTATMV
jgi:hypothetical protein